MGDSPLTSKYSNIVSFHEILKECLDASPGPRIRVWHLNRQELGAPSPAACVAVLDDAT